jgi:hypothetical protein
MPDKKPDTITVASRIPMAIQMSMEGYPSVTINGSNHREVLDGAGLTEGVDPAMFEAWMKMHATSDAVMQGLIGKVDPSKVEEVRADLPQTVAATQAVGSAAPPAPTERADVADLKAIEESKIKPEPPPKPEPPKPPPAIVVAPPPAPPTPPPLAAPGKPTSAPPT